MAKFTIVSLAEARQAVYSPRRATREQYREYVRSLQEGSAGKLVLEPDDRALRELARLRAAAAAEGIHLEILRQGNIIVFYEVQDAPKSAGKRAQRAPGHGQGRRQAPRAERRQAAGGADARPR